MLWPSWRLRRTRPPVLICTDISLPFELQYITCTFYTRMLCKGVLSLKTPQLASTSILEGPTSTIVVKALPSQVRGARNPAALPLRHREPESLKLSCTMCSGDNVVICFETEARSACIDPAPAVRAGPPKRNRKQVARGPSPEAALTTSWS